MEPASTAAETRTVRTAAETVSRTQPEFTIPREITATDLRRMRKPINTSQPDVASAFIGADGRIWNIRKISGRSGQETLEIGPVGEPSVQSAMPIQDFVNMRNEAFRRFHSTAGVAAQPSSPSAGTTAAPVEGTPAAPERSG